MNTKPIITQDGKPEIIEYYNSTKGGVDTFDFMCGAYSCSRKTKRWPLCIFYGILNAAAINAYIIHCSNQKLIGQKPPTRRQFLRDLSIDLIKPFALQRLNIPQLSRSLVTVIADVCEIPVPPPVRGQAMAAAEGTSSPSRKRCVLCLAKPDRKTRFQCCACTRPICMEHCEAVCIDCNVNVQLQRQSISTHISSD